ncbi:MAG: AAA family ATPase [Bacteroidales bacterium]|nr:AAA family ATPase [Bacteroidales bacterium]
MQQIKNPQLELAYNFVQYTHRNIFLTGKAGTGKTTFLHQLKAQSLKRMVVVAPTGVAAINAGGVTIHSFFQLPFGPNVPKQISDESQYIDPRNRFSTSDFKVSREKINIMRSLDLLIIDEISMVRADLLDAIDEVLKRYRRNSKPFGGVQLLMIGDIQQLPPVVKNEDWDLLRPHYPSLFFFDSIALKQTNYISIELKHIYRQSNENFISILNKIRDNRLDQAALDELNKRYIPDFKPKSEEGYITLTTHNRQAQELNDSKLRELDASENRFLASVQGDFPEFSFPTDKELVLKVGAQVMFIKNDSSRDKLYYNGKIGIVTGFSDEGILVKCPDMDEPISLNQEKWDNMKYSLNETTKEITETPIGSFTQFPLKLAWAITIHKSQGLTFEKAIIYAGAAFAHGQVYVALSRCKTLEGLVLGTPIRLQGIISDSEVKDFSRKMEENEPDKTQLDDSRNAYQLELLNELFDYQSVVRNLYTFQKHAKENVNILPEGLVKQVAEIIENIKKTYIEVADKFAAQLKRLSNESSDIENNQTLQERLIKAVGYYAEQTEQLITDLSAKCTIDIDNKAVQKSLNEPLERIFTELKIKQVCLAACENGFIFKDYLSIRAKAQIEEPQHKKITAGNKKKEGSGLSAILKDWRNDKAEELGLDTYLILSQKSITEISKKMPISMQELKAIHGIGAQKQKQFGKEILDIIIKYRQDHKIETVVTADMFKIEEKVKEPKIDSKKVSYDLFKTGKTIEEIALERNFSITTIEGHLAHFITIGELDLYKIMERSKAQKVIDYFESAPSPEFILAKNTLGDDYSYGEIRFVLAHLKSKADNE